MHKENYSIVFLW